MNKFFYPKLAFSNLKNNKKAYVPYVLTCIATILMFYNMYAISANSALNSMAGGETLKIVLALGNVVIGIFSIIFLIYTNQFLMKGRKKEIGLFNILGMEKKHLSIVMFYETLYVASFSFVVGILSGIIFSKLVYLALAKILDFQVRFGFFISVDGILVSAMLFAALFFFTFIINLGQIHLANPIELLKGDKLGEREPKVRWLILVIGILSLAGGYYISLTVTNPIKAIMLFFVAVILVIIGTYCLFTTGSIALLKLLRKNKNYYYKTKNFISVSSMIHRMKQNAIGLANICILSTMVLVMLSTTISLYVGIDDIMKDRFPRNMEVNVFEANKEKQEKVDEYIEQILAQYGANVQNQVNYIYLEFIGNQVGDNINIKETEIESNSSVDDYSYYTIITLDDYNRLVDENHILDDNEILLFTKDSYSYDSLSISHSVDNEYIVIQPEKNDIFDKINLKFQFNNYLIVTKDITNLEEMVQLYASVNQSEDNTYDREIYLKGVNAFDIINGSEKELEIYQVLRSEESKGMGITLVESAQDNYESFLAIYGGLFFLGIFLGILFMIATILIMYYKQVSEGFEDRERFQIMRKVGLSQEEVKKTISSQVLTVFFLPLAVAIIHIVFAFPMITKLLALMNLSNIPLFIICSIITVIVFAIVYAIVYILTAKEYYKIVA